jgi:aspartyl protease family protein
MFGLNDTDTLRFVFLAVLLVLLVGSIGLGRTRGAAKFRHLGIWILVAAALVIVYTYRGPVLDMAAPVLHELTPSHIVEVAGPNGEHQLVVRRSNDGHFKVDAEVNGVPVRFLIDTGATTTVLTAADAKRAGIDTSTLAFDRGVQTANGLAFFARTWLNSLTIGPYRLASVPVGVMPAGAMDTSLLGMSTINRFSSWRVEGDRMVLVP